MHVSVSVCIHTHRCYEVEVTGTYNHMWNLRTELRHSLLPGHPQSQFLFSFGFSPNIQVHQKSGWLKRADKKLLNTKWSFRGWKSTLIPFENGA